MEDTVRKGNNKHALVTGANRGIGRAIARGLANMGYRVILTGRNEPELLKVSKEITNNGGLNPVIYNLDITSEESLDEMIVTLRQESGTLDILVNNAGVHFRGTLELPLRDFKLMLETNLTAQFMVLKRIVPFMKQQGTGYIFNIASRSGKTGFPNTGGYCASKFGMVGLNESLYRELVPLGIKVTALCPAWVNTNMALEAGTELEPWDMIQPEDLMETIRWLLNLSPGACVKEVVITNPRSL